jgi:hypothetical protein
MKSALGFLRQAAGGYAFTDVYDPERNSNLRCHWKEWVQELLPCPFQAQPLAMAEKLKLPNENLDGATGLQ